MPFQVLWAFTRLGTINNLLLLLLYFDRVVHRLATSVTHQVSWQVGKFIVPHSLSPSE